MFKILSVILLTALWTASAEAQYKLKQGVAVPIPTGIFVDETDGITPIDNATVASIEFTWRQPYQTTTIESIIVNGAFADATAWTLAGTGTISGGTLNAVNESGLFATNTLPVSPCIQFVSYRVTYTISAYTDSTITVSLGGTAGTPRSSAATFSEEIVCGATGAITFAGGTNSTASIDNVIIIQKALRITAAASGTANDMILDEDGQYDLEMTAEQLSVRGPHVLCAVLTSTFVPLCHNFEVIATGSYGPEVDGNVSLVAPVIDAVEGIGTLIGTPVDTIALDIAGITADAVTIVPKNVEYVDFPILMRNTASPTTGVTGQTVTCTRSVAGAAFAAAGGGSAAGQIGSGYYKLTLSAADMSGNYVIVICTGTGTTATSQPYHQLIFTQRP